MELEYVVSHIGGFPNSERHYLVDKPWFSQKSSKLPIEIVLQIRHQSNVEKIEIVAHNTFIPKKLTILSGKTKEEDGYIGEVQFKSRKSQDQKYELKNIFLDESCSKLILSVSEAHFDVINNLDSIVGLVDVKLFGKYLTSDSPEPNIDTTAFKAGETKNSIPDHKFSKELLAMNEAIERNKQTAVANEDFKLAKSAQLAVRQLKKSTKEMEELENDKNEAVEEEDFQRANDLQDEINALRSNILASIDPRLLDNTMPRNEEIHRPKNLFPENSELPPQKPKLFQPVDLSPTEVPADPAKTFLLPPRNSSRSSTSTPKRPSTNDSILSKRASPTWEIPVRPITTDSQSSTSSTIRKRTPSPIVKKPSSSSSSSTFSSTRRRSISNTGMGTNKFLEKENMIVPAALNRKRSSSVNHDSLEFIDKSNDDVTEDQVLALVPPDQRANIRMAISIFGLETIAKLYSKHFEHRKEGIEELRLKIDALGYKSTSRNFESINCLLAHLLKEPLFNVYKDVLLLWHHFCTNRLTTLKLEKHIQRVASETSDTLATRVLSSDKRLVNETLVTFRDACKQQFIAKAYASKLLSSNSKNLKGRAVLVEIISKLYGVPHEPTGLTDNLIAGFATKCIRTSDPQVRTIGKDLMVQLYKNGATQVVRKELDRFASTDSNNPTYQKIAREIYNFDGTNRLKTEKKNKNKKISFRL